MNKLTRDSILTVFLIVACLILAGHQVGLAQETEDVQERLAQLENSIEDLKERIPKIGYVNRSDAFSVFPQAVEEERKEMDELEQKIQELNTRANKGEVSQSEYKREMDLLQAKHLKARIDVDLALLDKMIASEGFTGISDRLKELRKQTKPMQDTMTDLIEEIEGAAVSPQKVTNTLNQVGNQQFKQLDNILTNLAQLKITEAAQKIAKENKYDLIVEMQNVILYRDEVTIDNITDEVKERLKTELEQK